MASWKGHCSASDSNPQSEDNDRLCLDHWSREQSTKTLVRNLTLYCPASSKNDVL